MSEEKFVPVMPARVERRQSSLERFPDWPDQWHDDIADFKRCPCCGVFLPQEVTDAYLNEESKIDG